MAAVHSFDVQSARVHVPIHSRNTAGPPSALPVASIAPTTGSWIGRQHNSPGHSFHQLRWWEREFRSCLTAAHCILCPRNLVFVVSAFSVVLCCRVCVPSHRASTSKDSKSRTYMRKSSVHAPDSANVARLPANSMLNFRRIPGESSSPSACSLPSQALTSNVGPTRPTGLQQPQPVRTLNHVAWSIGDGNACGVAKAS